MSYDTKSEKLTDEDENNLPTDDPGYGGYPTGGIETPSDAEADAPNLWISSEENRRPDERSGSTTGQRWPNSPSLATYNLPYRRKGMIYPL